jgi:tetratricopeptide (TPR) repeat protein
MVTEAWTEGLRLYREGAYEQALYFLEDIDAQEAPEAPYYQALSYTKLARTAEALAILDQLVSAETSFLKLLQIKMIRAFLLTTERRYPEAEAALRGLIEEGVESVQVFSNYGYVLWALGRGNEAVAWLNRALEKDPENANALNSIGYILADQELLLDKALAFCRKALAGKKDHPPYLDSVGWVYHKMGLDKQAVTYLQKAVDADPETLDYRIHLVEVERALGRAGAGR